MKKTISVIFMTMALSFGVFAEENANKTTKYTVEFRDGTKKDFYQTEDYLSGDLDNVFIEIEKKYGKTIDMIYLARN